MFKSKLFADNLARLQVHMLMSNECMFIDKATGFILAGMYRNNLCCVKGQFQGNKFVGFFVTNYSMFEIYVLMPNIKKFNSNGQEMYEHMFCLKILINVTATSINHLMWALITTSTCTMSIRQWQCSTNS